MMRGEVIQVLTAGSTADPYSGGTAEDWDNPTERDLMTLAPAEPRPSKEPLQDARNSVTSGFTLYLPAGDPITRKDRVRVRGEVYPVRGTPAAWGHFGIVVQAFSEED